MGKFFLTAQVINIIGITNFLTIVMIRDRINSGVVTFSLFFSGALFIGSLLTIIVLSILFLRRVEFELQKCSSNFSPLFKHIMPNFLVASVLITLQLGFVYNADLIKVSLITLIIFAFPIIYFFKSVFVTLKGDEIRLCDYSDDIVSIRGSQLKKVGKVQFGLLYKIKYADKSNVVKTVFFFAKGSFFVFNEPNSVKVLKSMIPKAESI